MRKRLYINSILYWPLLCLAACASVFSLQAFPGAMFAAKGNTVLSFILAFGLAFLYHKALGRATARRVVFAVWGGAIFATCQALGDVLQGKGGLPSAAMLLLGYFLLYTSLLVLLFVFLDERCSSETPYKIHENQGTAVRNMHKLQDLLFARGCRSLLLCWGILLLSWLFWLVVFFPGLMSVDTWVQMLMVFGGRQLSSHHPILHTAYVGGFMALGKALFGNMAAGFALGTVLQWLLVGLAVSYGIQAMAAQQVLPKYCTLALLFYAAYPFVGMFSITLVKDIWLSLFVMLFVVAIGQLLCMGRHFFASWQRVLGLVLCCFGLLISKNTGIYIFAITLVFLVLALKESRVPLLALLCAGFLLYAAMNGPLLRAVGAEKGDLREMLPTPITQVAAVVKYNESAISEEDKKLIASVLPYSDIKRDYNTQIADFIKDKFDTKQFLQNPGAYIALYMRLGLQNPGIYIKSFLEQSYGYWYPDALYWNFHYLPYTSFVREYEVDFGGKEQMAGLYSQPFATVANATSQIGTRLVQLPFFSMIFSVGIWFWLLVVLALYAFYQRQGRLALQLLPLVVVWLSCLVSPMYSEMRYMLPLVFSIPFCVGIFTKSHKIVVKSPHK